MSGKILRYFVLILLTCAVFNPLFSQGKRNIGILPFENLTKNAKYDWVGFGLEYMLENKLSGIASFYVPNKKLILDALSKRNISGPTYNGDAVYQVGRETGINAGIIGRYRIKGNNISFKLIIINAFSGSTISEDDYEYSLNDIFSLADVILDKLIERSGVYLSEQEQLISARQITRSVKAFEYFCLGYIENENPNAKPESTTALFRRAIREDPKFWEAYYNLGIIYFNNNNYREAREQFDIIINALPDFEKPYYGRGLILYRESKFEDAEKDFLKVIEFNPNDYKGFLYLGKISIELQKYSNALKYLNQVTEINPDFADAYFEIGNLWFNQNRFDRAIPEFKKAVDLDPVNYVARQKLGESYYRQQIYYSAINEFDVILQNNPVDPLANFMMGITVYKQAVLNDLIGAFLEMLESNNAPVPKQDTNTPKREELYEKMADHFKRAHLARTNFLEATFNLALTYHEMGRMDEALNYFNQSLAMDPKLVKAYIKKAHTYEIIGEKQKALEEYKKVVRLEPAYFVSQPTLGPIHHYINIIDLVLEEIDETLKNNPNDLASNETLAKLYYAQGYYGKAANLFRKVLSINPGNKEAKEMLAKLENK